jgi:hypothetical protein
MSPSSALQAPPYPTARRTSPWAPVVAILLVVGLLVLGQFLVVWANPARAGPLGLPAPAPGVASFSHAAGHPAPPSGPVSSGRGTFFVTHPLHPNNGTRLCDGTATTAACFNTNVSTDPSVAILPSGTIAVAYTAYTNFSWCGNLSNYTLTEVGFQESTNGGASWSAPVYLGNTQCNGQNATWWANSWEPAMTVLPNGTLVVAYEQWSEQMGHYGCYSYGYCYNDFPYLSASYNNYGTLYAGGYNQSRLVVSELYPSASAWTPPVVLNQSTWDPTPYYYGPTGPVYGSASYVDENPTIASSGNTVYIAWQNSSLEPQMSYWYPGEPMIGDSGVQFVSSTNGGQSWSAQQAMPVLAGNYSLIAANPDLIVTPSGQVVLSYITGMYTVCVPYKSGTYTGCYYYSESTPVVGNSSTNGSSWTWSYLPVQFTQTYQPFQDVTPAFVSLQPQLAFDPVTQKVVVAYQTFYNSTACYSYGCYPNLYDRLAIASSNLTAWSFQPRMIGELAAGMNASVEGPYSEYLMPSIAINANGTLYLSTGYWNDTYSQTSIYGYTEYGAPTQIFAWSTNDGASFTPPIVMTMNVSIDYTTGAEGYHPAELVPAGSANVDVLWTYMYCNNWTLSVNCYYNLGNPTNPFTDLEFSQLFNGTGVTVSFNETGLPAGTPWSIDFGGNVRAGLSPTTLSLSGVPTGVPFVYSVSNYTTGSARYAPTLTLANPVNLTGWLNVTVTYFVEYLVLIQSSPNIPLYTTSIYSCYTYVWDSLCPNLNYNITGSFGALWVPNGTVLNTTVSYVSPLTFSSTWCPTCYFPWLNLTFLSFSGTGKGSINTTSNTSSLKVGGPIVETANFLFNSYCTWTTSGSPKESCAPTQSYFTFSEVGLPNGTVWGVDLYGTSGNGTMPYLAQTGNQSLTVNDPNLGTLAYYLPLTVPGAGNTLWVATGSPASPVEYPYGSNVVLHYHQVSSGTGSLSSAVMEVGLPTGTAWSYSVNGASSGTASSLATEPVALGTDLLNASPVYFTNGTGYYLAAIHVLHLVPNGTWTNDTSIPATLSIESSVVIEFVYALQYELTVAASMGGSAAPGTAWYDGNASVALNATPAGGYFFVAWTGYGVGAVNASTPTIHVTLGGAVRELATFQVNPAVRYVPTVHVVGLPLGATVTVAFNGSTFTGNDSFALPAVLPGNYNFSAAAVMANGTTATQYVPTNVASSFPAGTGATYQIVTNGTITVTYQVDYALTVVAGPDGSATPLGNSWQAAGASVPVQAVPSAGYEVLGWVGSGNGSVSNNQTTISVSMAGPISETVTFVPIPPTPRPTYAISVGETGLPTGTAWSITVNGTGTQGTTQSLSVVSLAPGTYTVGVAAVAAGTGTEYAPNVTTMSVTLSTAPATLSVQFGTDYWLALSAGTGGTITDGKSGWYASGTTVTITAAPNAGYTFASWNGTGGPASQASLTVTMSGPVSEVASFAPASSPGPASSGGGSSTAGLPLDLGLLAALLVVGLLVALLLGRRRRESPPAGGMGMAKWDDSPETSPPPPPSDEAGAQAWGDEPPKSA